MLNGMVIQEISRSAGRLVLESITVKLSMKLRSLENPQLHVSLQAGMS